MSKRIVFEEIKARLVEKMPELKTIRLYNNQVSSEREENAFNYPAVFVEFNDITYSKAQSGLQGLMGFIRLYLVQEEYHTENLEILDFVDKVANSLNGYQSTTIYNALWREQELQDTSHNNLIVWQQDYPLTANDCTSSKYNGSVIIAGNTVEAVANRDTEVTLDIDNKNIRTGDGVD